MSINIVPPLLGRPGFVGELAGLVRRCGLAPAEIKIEVTEVVAMDDTPVPAETMQALRRLGMVVCLDDFGTGYASLSWLHRFPVDEIKIDKSFIAELCSDRRSQILVGAALSLAHSLGLPVVAEGVETEEQARELRTAACEYAQGYLFGRPLEAREAEKLLTGW